MNIAGTDYDLNNKALSVFVSGCDGKCPECHNQELWDFTIGRDSRNPIQNTILGEKIKTSLVKHVWVMGGCPMLQDLNDLEEFLRFLYKFNKPVWLWTRFYEKDIPLSIKQYLSYIKVGEYQCESGGYKEKLFGITLASMNQKIIKL